MTRRSAIRRIHRINQGETYELILDERARLISPLQDIDRIRVSYMTSHDMYLVDYYYLGHVVNVDTLDFDKMVIEMHRWLVIINRRVLSEL